MSDRSIAESIRTLAGTNGTNTVFLYDATVNSVDEDNRVCSCTVVSGENPTVFTEVRLMASLDDGILIIPSIDSNVILIGGTHCDFFVSQFSEVDKIVLLGGDLAGLVKLLPLLKDLNNIQNDINTLKEAFKSWVVSPSDGGAALKAVSANWYGATLPLSDRAVLENINIIQG